MKRWMAIIALLAAWASPSVASAHPLGNFTINHYSRIEPDAEQVHITYVLDEAEIPTFQDKPRLEAGPEQYADQRAEEIRRNLHLSLDGQATEVHLVQRQLSFPTGSGGLPTLRLEAVYAAEMPAGAKAATSTAIELTYRDDNDPTRIGWREIVARPAAADTRLVRSTVPAQDVTDGLRSYPEDLLSSPLNVREAQLSFLPGGGGAAEMEAGLGAAVPMLPMVPSSGGGVLERTRSALAELANGKELTPTFLLFAVGVAIVLGAAHALQPGHGKTIVAAYLVGSRGTPRHALFLGATVTATHTAGVYALGLVTLFLSQYVVPERLYPVLEVISGLLVVGIGVWLFGSRILATLRPRLGHGHGHSYGHSHDHGHEHAHGHARAHAHEPGHDHPHGHDHAHGHDHDHTHEHPVGWRSLLALGVSGGLLPCPEALMVLLITIAAHRILFGLLLIVAFSTGLAGVLVGFGLLLVYARGFFKRINLSSGLAPRILPVASALVIVVAGAVITLQALPQVLPA